MQSLSAATQFEYGGQTYQFDDLNLFCFPQNGSPFETTFAQLKKTAIETGQPPSVVHMKFCNEPAQTDGGNLVAPTLWIIPLQKFDFENETDQTIQNAVDSLMKQNYKNFMKYPQTIEAIKNFNEEYKKISDGIEGSQSDFFMVRQQPRPIISNTLTAKDGDEVVVIPQFNNVKIINKTMFSVWINYPAGFGFERDFPSILTEISDSLRTVE